MSDGCTLWFDGAWRHCCEAHDLAYETNAVTLQSHVELGQCVAQTDGGLLMGVVMMIATTLWWLAKRKK